MLFMMFGVMFVGLKLAGVIDWSWVWVTAPIWGMLGLGVISGAILEVLEP